MKILLEAQREQATFDLNKAHEVAEDSLRRLKSENLQLQKENGKHVVHIRQVVSVTALHARKQLHQVERQLSCLQEKTDKEDRLKLSLMEDRLLESQEALKEVC